MPSKQKTKTSQKKNAAPAKKKSPVKKAQPAAKKTSTPKETPARKKIISELNSLLKQMSDSEAVQILRQTKILLHNKSVIESSKMRNVTTTVETMRGNIKPQDKSRIEIKEADDGSSFVLAINGSRNFFALDEMRKIVKICHSSENVKDASSRLYSWFVNFRMDVVNNTKIKNSTDPALATIYNALITRYTVKK